MALLRYGISPLSAILMSIVIKIPFRLKASLIHLFLSLLVGLAGIAIVFGIWYPAPMHIAVGVTKIFLLLLVVDMILGPLLTLLVAKKGKPSLKFDLSVIAIFQISAYLYGMYSIASARPVWIAFDNIRFETVMANAVEDESRTQASVEYQNPGWWKPEWIAVAPPANNQEKSDRLFYELQTGVSPAMRPHLYQPLLLAWTQMEAKKKSLAELYEKNDKDHIDAILAKYPEADAYLPLAAPEKDMVVLMDSQNEKILKIVDASP